MTEERNPRRRVKTIITGKSRTEQAHRGECNINQIMKKCRKTGLLPNRGEPGFYGDFSEVGDFQESQNKVILAQERFMTLPAEIRKKFDNDPGKLLDFMADPENIEKAIELGIIPRPVEVAPEEPVEPVTVPEDTE